MSLKGLYPVLLRFKEFLRFSVDEQQELYSRTSKKLNTLESYIEKDFWVCLTLEILFNHLNIDDPKLLFKGGTSLSKVYGVINRFSEDIDITVFPKDLGFEIEDIYLLGTKARQRFLDELSSKCDDFLFNSLINTLNKKFNEAGAYDVEIVPDEEHTILIKYPTLFWDTQPGYIKPMVKIESGARSAVDPHTIETVSPYTQEALDLGLIVPNICTIKAERTFCDKLIILHGLRSGYEKKGRIPQDSHRVARHYYDLAMMNKTDIGNSAIKDSELQESARKHCSTMFASSWRGYETARPGSYAIVPQDELLKAVEADYKAMETMIFGTIPGFETIMSEIQEIENRLNVVSKKYS